MKKDNTPIEVPQETTTAAQDLLKEKATQLLDELEGRKRMDALDQFDAMNHGHLLLANTDEQ